MKQTLLVMGSTLALMVVGWELHLLVAYPGPYTFILFGATVPVFVIVGLGFFKLA
ncbi:hypothetical protein [Bradyrhizobium sp. DOA1]|uniref:hypothetical protein n=1 Tax=Bradyrhizobium sp. DOA1 TaxID=1126616 RepID=UPI0012E761CD|nr:hypothetical protein [Bradyrhizobium sp. DOA1]